MILTAKCVLCVYAAVLHAADQRAAARQLQRRQAGGGGVPRCQAVALQSLPQGGPGRLGEETHRAGPVLYQHLRQETDCCFTSCTGNPPCASSWTGLKLYSSSLCQHKLMQL